jgi:hypothetical protein
VAVTVMSVATDTGWLGFNPKLARSSPAGRVIVAGTSGSDDGSLVVMWNVRSKLAGAAAATVANGMGEKPPVMKMDGKIVMLTGAASGALGIVVRLADDGEAASGAEV